MSEEQELIQYLQDAIAFMDDTTFERCLNRASKVLERSVDSNQGPKVAKLLTDLAVYSLQFRIGYAYYMGPGKKETDAMAKKNLYRSTYEGVDGLISALKYLAKSYE